MTYIGLLIMVLGLGSGYTAAVEPSQPGDSDDTATPKRRLDYPAATILITGVAVVVVGIIFDNNPRHAHEAVEGLLEAVRKGVIG